MLLLLQNIPEIPIALGPTGSIILGTIALGLAVFNAYQWRKSSEARHWRGASEAYEKELEIVRSRADRLDAENKELVVSTAQLKAKTDLTTLQQQGMDFERKNQEVHEKIVTSLGSLVTTNTSHYAQLTAVLAENTSAVRALGERMTSEMELHRQAFAQMTNVLSSLSIEAKTREPRDRVGIKKGEPES